MLFTGETPIATENLPPMGSCVPPLAPKTPPPSYHTKLPSFCHTICSGLAAVSFTHAITIFPVANPFNTSKSTCTDCADCNAFCGPSYCTFTSVRHSALESNPIPGAVTPLGSVALTHVSSRTALGSTLPPAGNPSPKVSARPLVKTVTDRSHRRMEGPFYREDDREGHRER